MKTSTSHRYSRLFLPENQRILREFLRKQNPTTISSSISRAGRDAQSDGHILHSLVTSSLMNLKGLSAFLKSPKTEPQASAAATWFYHNHRTALTLIQWRDYLLDLQTQNDLLYVSLARMTEHLILLLARRLIQLLSDPCEDSFGLIEVVTSLRQFYPLVAAKEVVASTSTSERFLEKDPSGTYLLMDSISKDIYRDAVSRIALETGLTEAEIGRRCLALAQQASVLKPANELECNIGFYLLDDGQKLVYGRQMRHPFLLRSHMIRHFIRLQVICSLVIALFATILASVDITLGLVLFVAWSTFAFPCSRFILEQLIVPVSPPTRMPRLGSQYSKGMASVALAIPTVIGDDADILRLRNRLKELVFNLSNVESPIALITDISETLSQEDARIEAHLVTELQALVTQHRFFNSKGQQAHLVLLHRRLDYSPTQRKRIGWERKRGKLIQLNRLILEGDESEFSSIAGNVALLRKTKYVCVLDDDTFITSDALEKLLATLQHPLNKPSIDDTSNCLLRGYSIAQPLIGVSSVAVRTWRFPTLLPFSAKVAGQFLLLSPRVLYGRALHNQPRNVCQHIFGEVQYGGRGLYHVRSFDRLTRGRLPLHTVLSHDVVEGGLARACHVNDAIFYEGSPGGYEGFVEREHRWQRGDCQNIVFLQKKIKDEYGQLYVNKLSRSSQSFIWQNVIFALFDGAGVALVLIGCSLPPKNATFEIMVAMTLYLIPCFHLIVRLLVDAYAGLLPRYDLSILFRALGRFVTLSMLDVTMMSARALTSIDAITLALFRLLTRRKLLEWRPSNLSKRSSEVFWRARVYPFLGAFCAWSILATLYFNKRSLIHPCVPILLTWTCAPAGSSILEKKK